MVAEALVKEPLTTEMIEAGVALVQLLDQRLPLTAAFWFFLSESNTWRLYLASPAVAKQGPLKVYRQVQATLRELRQEVSDSVVAMATALDLEAISVIADDDPLVVLFRRLTPADIVPRGKRTGVRVKGAAVTGAFIEDAFIYKL